MQYLRDNAGVLEASNNGTDWQVVQVGSGGGGPPAEVVNPVTLGTLQVRDNAGVLEISADDGATWSGVGVTDHTLLTNIGTHTHAQIDAFLDDPPSGGVTDHTLLTNIGTNTHTQLDSHVANIDIHGAHPPATLANPVTIGQLHIQDNGGNLQFSSDGATWYDFYAIGWNLSLVDKKFYPPAVDQADEPNLWGGAMSFWVDTNDNNRVWLVYKTSQGIQKKIEML